MRLAVIFAATLAMSMAVTANTFAADYSYTTIASGNDTLFLDGCPAINNFGAVAFSAVETDPETFDEQDKMLRGSGGALTTIADETNHPITSVIGNPSINDLGAVAFDANPTGTDSEVIVRGSGGPLTEIARARSTGPRFDSFTADVSLNNFGRVAFTGELNDALSDQGLFEGSGGAVATRYTRETSQFDGSIAAPSLNDLGQVAFEERTDSDVNGIFRQNPGGSGSETTIADSTGGLSFFDGDVSLNNLGRAAFIAFDDDFTGQAIYTGRGGALTEVANTAGEYESFNSGGASLDDLGRVAFQAGLDDFSSSGVFTGPNSVRDAVIRTGDRIRGKRVQEVTACREMLNVRGQIAARVFYLDGTSAIIRATPRR